MKIEEIRTGMEAEQGARWLHRTVRVFRFLFGLMVATGVVLYFYPSGEAQAALHQKIDSMSLERDALRSERDAQVRKMEWIKSDDQYLEIAARDRLGLQKDGEFIIRFQSKDAPIKK